MMTTCTCQALNAAGLVSDPCVEYNDTMAKQLTQLSESSDRYI